MDARLRAFALWLIVTTPGCIFSSQVEDLIDSYDAGPSCVPDCTDRMCGDDGCGGSCGSCTAEGDECLANQCVPQSRFERVTVSSGGGSIGASVDSATGANGETTVIGRFGQDTIVLDQGLPTEQTLTPVSSSTNTYALFAAAYTAEGTLRWATQTGGTGTIWSSDVDVRPDGSRIVAGSIQEGEVTFPTAAGDVTARLTDGEFVVAGLDASGQFTWVEQFTEGRFIETLDDGSWFLVGTFSDTIQFDSGNTVLTSRGEDDVFYAHFNADNSFDWAMQGGGVGDDDVLAVDAYEQELVIIGTAGATPGGEAQFGRPGVDQRGAEIVHPSMFVASSNGFGGLRWLTFAESSSEQSSIGVDAAAMLTNRSVAVFGSVRGELSLQSTRFAPAPEAVNDFMLRLDANGDLASINTFVADTTRIYTAAAVRSGDGVVACVQISGTGTLDKGGPRERVVDGGSDDDGNPHLVFYDADGAFKWARPLNTGNPEQRANVWMKPAGSDIVVSGLFGFRDGLVFGKGEPNETEILRQVSTRFYLAKFSVVP